MNFAIGQLPLVLGMTCLCTCPGGVAADGQIREQLPVNALLPIAGGQEIIVGGQAGLLLQSWGQSQEQQKLDCPVDVVYALKWSPDGQHLAVAGGSAGEYGQLAVLSWPSRVIRPIDVTHDDVIFDIAWRSDGKQLFCASLDGRISRVDTAEGVTVATVDAHTRGVTGACWLPGSSESLDDQLLVTCGMDNTLRVWNTEQQFTQLRSLNNHTQPVNCLAPRLSEDGGLHIVASAGNDRTVRFWQPRIGRMMRFVRLESPALSLQWLTKGNLLVAGCRDGQLRIIDADRAEVVSEVAAVSPWAAAVAVADDNRRIAVGCMQGVRFLTIDD